jgi:hypothetical protein
MVSPHVDAGTVKVRLELLVVNVTDSAAAGVATATSPAVTSTAALTIPAMRVASPRNIWFLSSH